MKIKYSKEETLLGTATPIKRIEKLYPGFCSEGPFLVIYADNLTNMDLKKVFEFHELHKPLATLTLHEHDEPWTRGIIDMDEDGKVLNFLEKPNKEDILSGKYPSESASCVYLFEPEVLKYLKDEKEDLGTDLFPRLIQDNCRLYGFNPHACVMDTGTLERYETTKRAVAENPERFIF